MCRTKRFLLAAGAVVLMTAVALAVAPQLIFELDGNVADSPAGFPDDWNTLNGDCTQPGISGSPGSSNARTCIGAENPPTIFTQGGSKDPNDITQWRWKPRDTVPDKDTITHAFAASYNDPATGNKIVVIGGDRFAVNGSANIGAWLFQKEIKLNSNGTFSGVHTDGDVFLVSAFVNGGGTAVVQAYEWIDACTKPPGNAPPTPGDCAEDNLRYLGTADTFAITNSATVSDASWSYQGKFGIPANDIPPGGLFEAGADLTVLFAGQEVPCFSTFLLESRSSQEPSAVLKDFVLGSFPECKVSIAKSCSCIRFDPAGKNSTNNTGYDYTFSGTVTNSGGGTVFNVTVTDQGKTYDCGTMNTTTSKQKSFGGASAVATPTDALCAGPAGTFSDDIFPTTNQATVTAQTSATGGTTITAQTDPVSCSSQNPAGACTPNPQITVDKTCVTALQVLGSNVVVRVDYTGQVHNTGNVNLTNVQVTSDHNDDGSVDATFTVGTLTPVGTAGADKCYTNNAATCPALPPIPAFNSSPVAGVASYFPNTGTGVTPGRVRFSDTVRATGTDAFGTAVASHPSGSGVTAHCLICPFGACPATQ